ncbi:DUF63 family protein [Halosegnis marinus]|uniref:DUF63 family protein n=1 Tax=Halosegnis marinus TaxID=3034023 RepID=A0ABD5ZSA0_9EURY|nr:DUF63 family protein [Halosegnis sp. DT85]
MQDPREWDRGRAWLATLVAAVAALAGGALLAPDAVWDGFLWHYFWGPVYADANNAVCAAMRPGGPELLFSQSACAAADAATVVAEPGYTVVSEIGYAVTLVFFLVGLLELLNRLDIGSTKRLFYALVPFMFFGGALRVVEDANDAVPQGVEALLSYPANSLIISPVIYFTVFFLTLGAIVATVYAARAGYADHYDRPLFAVGWGVVLATVGFLFYFVTAELAGAVAGAGFYPQMTGLTIGLAAVLAVAVYALVDRVKPEIHEGTGLVGLVVLFGHAVDGVANVIAADWVGAIGVPVEYGAKHPANRFVISVTEQFQPAWLSEVIGTSWAFLVVKLVAATLVVWVFDERIFDEEPRYAVLLLVAILAVGLGPGSRDMLRVTFGI